MPYILKQINVPVFGTLLTLGLLENKLREHKMLDSTTRHTVVPGEKVKLGQMVVEFIHTNHSIADAVALAIHTPVGVVVHTGDFKVDYTPIDGDVIDLQRFAALGKEGVLLLMSDSTISWLRPSPQTSIVFSRLSMRHICTAERLPLSVAVWSMR